MRAFTKLFRAFSTLQKAGGQGTVAKREGLQFSKKRLTDFGELPQGQIPEALQYDLPSNLTTLANGVKVASETTQGPFASVTVHVKAGTRYETLKTSGTCKFLERLHLRGTSGKNRAQVEKELDQFGGKLCIQTGRESTQYTLSFEPAKLNSAVSFLGDILLNSTYDKSQVEAEKEGIYTNCVENVKDQFQATMEAIHYTSFRDHFMGQPVNGIRENISSITSDHIKQFHEAHYVGPKIIISGAGNISHNDLVSAAESAFGNAAKESKVEIPNTQTPFFTPSMMYMRDDEMANVNIGVFFAAPAFNDPDYFAMKLFQSILGDYRADKYTGKYLNSADRQYSLLHSELGQMPDVTLHKCEYFPYSDTGLFGNYLYGNEVFANAMLFLSQGILSEYASYINPVELYRGRNKLYNKLLEEGNSWSKAKENANEVAYFDRLIPRSEEAYRYSHFDTGLINRAATRWFWDKEISVVAWGPIHGLMQNSHYNRPIRRSTVGWYGTQHGKIV